MKTIRADVAQTRIMRILLLLLVAVVVGACSSKQAHEEEVEIITRTGLITVKEDVSLNDVEKDSKTRTSVYGSVSSGGGISIGLGFLLGSSSSRSDPDPVRYEVNLQDDSKVTIYSQSRDFEVGDCVEIRSHPDEKKHPPVMKRKAGGC
jgi:hypothetical protein